MSWMSRLCDVYDYISSAAAQGDSTLVPIGFIQKTIKYNIILSPAGEFVTAQIIPKENQLCVVPSTAQAEGRTGDKGAPFPLADQLKYIIADGDEPNPRFDAYLSQLTAWSSAPDAPDSLKVLITYLQKRTLYADMMRLPGLKFKYHQDEAAKDGNGSDAKSFACFSIQYPDEENRLWLRPDVRASWQKRCTPAVDENAALCYVTGLHLPLMEKHPKLLGNAKLISAEDAGFPFQYRGRFSKERSAVLVSTAASTKAHNALKWLLEHQGFRRFGFNFVGWNIDAPVMPEAEESLFDPSDEDEQEPSAHQPDTLEAYVNALFRSIHRSAEDYRQLSDPNDQTDEMKQRVSEIVLLGMQAATDGRMSIIYYQELPGNLFVQQVERWHSECGWFMPGKNSHVRPVTWFEICQAVMGVQAVRTALGDLKAEKSATKQMREMQLRLLHCTVNGAALPADMVSAAFRRAIQPSSFTDAKGKWQKWDWMRCVSTACAMIHKKRLDDQATVEITSQLDPAIRHRDYLYGRLLAIALQIEKEADLLPEEKTNALQLMPRFVQQPSQTWQQLFLKLIPSLEKLGGRIDKPDARHYLSLLGEIESLFEDRENASPLSELFLLGFSAQGRSLQLHGNTPAYDLPETRDELYGCLLAVADCCEAEVRKDTNSQQRGLTNALHMVNAYAASPSRTWQIIHDKLIPYLDKSGVDAARAAQRLICRIEQAFTEDDRLSDQPLGSCFLHGYLCMHLALRRHTLAPQFWTSPSAPLPEPTTREALFGALLALENDTERRFLDLQRTETENRSSNAMRFLSRAAQRPDEVWTYLRERMRPYAGKQWFASHIAERAAALYGQIKQRGFDTDSPLRPEYLHYFYLYSKTYRKDV